MGQKLAIEKLYFDDIETGDKMKKSKVSKPKTPTTTIREFEKTFNWKLNNWMALTETSAKEIKSPTYCIFAKGSRERYDDTAHRYNSDFIVNLMI